MTQSVADKTPISEKASKRHTDPPGLWIAVATISVTLHLLLFWLLRSYSSSLLLQRSSSNPVPVEFVEISSPRRASSKAKPVSPKRASTTQSPTARTTPTQENSTASPSIKEDSNAIAFTNTKKARTSQPQKEDITEQSSQQPVIESQAQPESQPVETFETTPQPEPTPSTQPLDDNQQPPIPLPPDNENLESAPTTPLDNEQPPTPLPNTADTPEDTQNQANQELDEQASNPTNSDSSPEIEQPQPSNEPTQTPSISSAQPGGDITVEKETPLEDVAPPVNPNQPTVLEQPTGIALATWNVETDAVKKDIQDNPPQIVGDTRQKELDFLALNRELSEQPIEFKAVLLIDGNGNLNSIILYPYPRIPEPQATQYQEYAEAIFKDQKFIPASNNNGDKPSLGELVVNIRIQRQSSNPSAPSPGF